MKNSEDRFESLSSELHANQTMSSTFIVDGDKHNNFSVTVDPVRKAISCSCHVTIDKGKAISQTTQLLRQLEPSGVTSEITVTALYPRNKTTGAVSLANLYEEKKKALPYSIVDKSLGEEFKYFELCIRREIGRDMTGSRNFVDKLEGLCETFLLQVVRYVLLGEKA